MYKLKDKYKGHKPINFSTPLDKLQPHQIKNLPKHLLKLYFIEVAKEGVSKIAKKIKKKISNIEDL
tara:strand:- start:5938 stop:6135 length:198 start_codon:yes stop_codon:yes gene_type:complete